LAEYSNPSITTVDIHRDMLGHIAADALHELVGSSNPQGKEYPISVELVVGDSTGPAPLEKEIPQVAFAGASL
jgi:DNA-binding LacI/PurR family transcriptional regulator